MLLSLVASVIPSAFAVSQSDIDALQAKKDEISARVKEAQERVDTLKEAQANVLDQKAYEGAYDKSKEVPIPAEVAAKVQEAYEKLVEEAASTDEALMEK